MRYKVSEGKMIVQLGMLGVGIILWVVVILIVLIMIYRHRINWKFINDTFQNIKII